MDTKIATKKPPTAEAGGFLFGSVLFDDVLIIRGNLVLHRVFVVNEGFRHADKEVIVQHIKLLGNLVIVACQHVHRGVHLNQLLLLLRDAVLLGDLFDLFKGPGLAVVAAFTRISSTHIIALSRVSGGT